MHNPTDRNDHTTAFVIPVVGRSLERDIAKNIHYDGSIHRSSRAMVGHSTIEQHPTPDR